MGSITGFKEIERLTEDYQDIAKRIEDYSEITISQHNKEHLQSQGARCMDCGVPFCQSDNGCPINNLIPEFNDLIYQNHWDEAYLRLAKTNNFPEFTGRVCPAPCEGSCVLGKTSPAVTIKNIEQAIIDEAFNSGLVKPREVKNRTTKTIAIVGSGPAGLAASDELNQMGHNITVFERDDRIGGLLMYGIPNMKLDKKVVNRRVDLLTTEGIEFKTGVNIGTDITLSELQNKFDVVLLTTGATKARDLDACGRESVGIYPAMQYLTDATKALLDNTEVEITAKDKSVIVIGGGDTGTDCIATALRQGAKNIINFELMCKPPVERGDNNPWPYWPHIYRVDYGHAEAEFKYGRDPREYQIMTKEFISENDKVVGVKTVNVEFEGNRIIELSGTEKTWDADLVLLSMGFVSPEIIDADIALDNRGNYQAQYGEFTTSKDNVFAAGDCRRGQSLVVWAINEGREVAKQIDNYLKNNNIL
jgi:glutamate synthase (NADPH/NADH) small chain